MVAESQLSQFYHNQSKNEKRLVTWKPQTLDFIGAGARNRTEMPLRAGDFESRTDGIGKTAIILKNTVMSKS